MMRSCWFSIMHMIFWRTKFYLGSASVTVVAKLMEDQLVHEHVHSELLVLALCRAHLGNHRCIILFEGPPEDHVDRRLLKLALKALLDYVGGELELAQTDEIRSDHLEDLIIPTCVVELQNVLYEVVSEGVLYQAVEVAYDLVGEG